ncbi:MAG: hypothetical protein JSW39_06500 [Desulfobacterales bacterium]|nr:MAG: hypothetical protein JSW39_06500 [Desulfobacterales bacterium]
MQNVTKSATAIALCLLLGSALIADTTDQSGIQKPVDYRQYLTTINPDFMITPDEAHQWHVYKDQGGPTYSD